MSDKKYQICPLSAVCKIDKGEQINGSELLKIGQYEFFNGGISASGYWDTWNVEGNSISISEGGNSCGYVNYQDKPYWCGAHCYHLSALKIDTYFLYSQLKTRQDEIMALRTGICMPNIKKKSMEEFEIVVPELTEQIRFSTFAQQSDKSKFELEQALNDLTATYKRIITENLG